MNPVDLLAGVAAVAALYELARTRRTPRPVRVSQLRQRQLATVCERDEVRG